MLVIKASDGTVADRRPRARNSDRTEGEPQVKIRVVIPVLDSEELVGKARDEYLRAAAPDVDLSFVAIPKGTDTIESQYDLALAQPETIRMVLEAERERIEACIIACFGDPGGSGAKEVVAIPVVGEGEAALHVASLLGYRYSIITVRAQTIPFMRIMAASAGLSERLASVRPVDFGVMDFSLSCVDDVVEQSAAAVQHDGAEAIVMGCTGTGVDMAPVVQERLQERLGVYVPVVDPVRAAISLAEGLVRAGLSQSKVSYPTPPSLRPEYSFADVLTPA
jgi:allantoin racemase